MVGVLFYGWDVAALVILYWSENLIIGAYNLLRMFAVGGIKATPLAAFFLIHYGGFCAVHGTLILSLLLDASPSGESPSWPLVFVFVELLIDVIADVLALAPREWILAFAGLAISHGYSFVVNFLRGGERDRTTLNKLMSAPYRRIIVLHVAVIAGGMGAAFLGEPLVLVVALIALKTLIDLQLHAKEHTLPPRY